MNAYDEDEYSTYQSPLEMKQKLDSEQDTNMFEDSCENEDSASHDVEDTDVLSNNVYSCAQEEYVVEDGAAVQLDDEDYTDHMPEVTAVLKSISEDVESHPQV
jgi:hypothetical protein